MVIFGIQPRWQRPLPAKRGPRRSSRRSVAGLHRSFVFQLGNRESHGDGVDGLSSQYFARIHPASALARDHHLTGLAVGGVAMLTDTCLLDLTNIGTLFAFALVCSGVIVLRKKDPNRPRPFRVPFVPVFPLLGVFLCGALMLSLPIETWLRFFIWLGLGLLIYFLYSVRHSRLRQGIDTGETENEFPPIVP